MKYLAAVVFLASCAMLTPVPVKDGAIEPPFPVINSDANPEVNPTHSEHKPETRKPKPKSSPPAVPPVSEVSSCANLDAGDLKETIKAKLDCITDNAK